MHTQEEIEESKIELANNLAKLYKNKDFKKLIVEGFLEQGSKYLTKNYTKVKSEHREEVIAEVEARSRFWKYLDGIEEEARSILEARLMD